MKQFHPIQLQILKKLLFAKDLRYSDLRPDLAIENNQLDFHLDRLIEAGYIQKNSDKTYRLSNKGKEYAGRMDTNETLVARQAKIGVLICCTQGDTDKRDYLIYTRLKHPFYGCQGFFSGKAKYGEFIQETAKRELKEETNLEGEPILVNIRHYRVFKPESNELLEDKFMYFVWIKDPTVDLVFNEEGKFEWVKESSLKEYVTNHFESFEDFMKQVNIVKTFTGCLTLEEIDHWSEKF